MNNTSISICYFQRTKKSDTERGIMINEDKLIIDKNSKPVKAPVWSYTVLPHELFVNVEL